MSIELIEYASTKKIKPLKLTRLVDPTKTQPIAKELGRMLKKMIKDIASEYLDILKTETDRVMVTQEKTSTIEEFVLRGNVRNITSAIDRATGGLSPLSRNVLSNLVIDSYKRGVETSQADLRKGGFIEKDASIPPSSTDDQLAAALEDVVGELITSVQNDFRKDVKRTILEGIAKDQTQKEISNEIKRLANVSMSSAERIARTEIVRAYNIAASTRYRQAGVKFLVWQASRERVKGTKLTKKDERTCPICDALHGRVVPFGQPFGRLKGKEIRLPPDPHPYCFSDKRTAIMTSKGRKQIKDIQVGDLVLTHNGQFKKVLKLHGPRYEQKVTRTTIFVEDTGPLSTNKIQATSNHPILVNCDGHPAWIPFGEVKIGDQIGIMTSLCRVCTKEIPYHRIYCSTSCQSKYDWKHRTDEEKKEVMRGAHEKIQELVETGQWNPSTWAHYNKSYIARQKASERMKGEKNIIHRPDVKMKVFGSDYYTKRTKPELRMAELLDKAGIKYEEQKRLQYEQFMIPDFALCEAGIIIEVDGVYWHRNSQDEDLKKTEILEKHGWRVLRFSDVEVMEDPDSVIEEVLYVLRNETHQYKVKWVNVIEIRQRVNRKGSWLYNFSVDGDESYIARGFVVHNCRCTVRPITVEQIVNKRKTEARNKKIRKILTAGQRITLTS